LVIYRKGYFEDKTKFKGIGFRLRRPITGNL